MAGIDLRTYVLLERSFVRRLQRSWQQKSAPTYEAIAKACTDHQWDEARRLVQDLDLTEVGTENREWITYMLLSCAVFGANIVAKKAPSFVGVGSFDTFLKQTVNNFLQYLEYSGTSQVQAEALQSIAEDEAKTKAIKWDEAKHPRKPKGTAAGGEFAPEPWAAADYQDKIKVPANAPKLIGKHLSLKDAKVLGEAFGLKTTDPTEVTKFVISAWRGGGAAPPNDFGRFDVLAPALNRAAQEEFGLKETDSSFQHSFRTQLAGGKVGLPTDIANTLYEQAGTSLRAFLRAQYTATQEVLAKQGLKQVVVFRGIRVDTHKAYPGLGTRVPVVESTVTLRPLASFSSRWAEARQFAAYNWEGYGNLGQIIAAKVPAKDVLALPGFGLGKTKEAEVVVLGGRRAARIGNITYTPDLTVEGSHHPHVAESYDFVEGLNKGQGEREDALYTRLGIKFDTTEPRDDKGKWTRKPEGLGGIAKKFDAALHPRGDDGRFVEATIPRIFNRPAELEMRKGWPGEPVRWSWKDPVTGEGTGRLLTGEPIAPEDMRATLYHVTTNAPAVESSGVLLGLLESGGLGGGQAPGVSFTSSKEDARVIQRELIRAVRVARGEVDENVFDQWAREDEKEAGLPQGSLQRAANYALEQSYRPNEFTLDKSFVWDDKLPDDKRGWVGPPHPPEERERLRRGLMKDALNAYLQLRPDAAAKAAGAEVPLLKNPILFGRQEHLAKLKPENVQILEVPSHLIPEGALVTTGSDKFLHEVRAYSDVPLPKKLQSIAKFDTTEPRDDKGRWEKVPGESLDAQDKGLVTERLKKLVSGEVYIGDAGGTSSRLTARVGSQVADVLEEMRAKGYSLPEDVAIYTTEARTPSGRTTEYVADEDTPRHSKGSSWRSLTIDMPRELPPYADLDKAARLVFAKNEGEYAVHSMKDIIIHEMGHVQAQKQESLDAFLIDHPEYTTERAKGAMERVSRYAMRNPDEFVAEAFTRMYRGEKLHPESMKLYKIWHGPEIRS